MIRGELFSQDMVKAFLENRKGRTSRPIKYGFDAVYKAACAHGKWSETYGSCIPDSVIEWYVKNITNPKHSVGDSIYVRETFCKLWKLDKNDQIIEGTEKFYYAADGYNPTPFNSFPDDDGFCGDRNCPKWCPSIHMPREAARLWFRVTDDKVQRLDDVTEQDAVEDGFEVDEDFNDFARDQAQGLRRDGVDVEIDYSTALKKFNEFWLNQYGPDASWMWVYYLKPITKEEALNG